MVKLLLERGALPDINAANIVKEDLQPVMLQITQETHGDCNFGHGIVVPGASARALPTNWKLGEDDDKEPVLPGEWDKPMVANEEQFAVCESVRSCVERLRALSMNSQLSTPTCMQR